VRKAKSRLRLTDYEVTGTEVAARLGITRKRVDDLERRAMMKIRALVLGTEDFPLLRSVYAEDAVEAERALLEDVSRLEAEWAKERAMNWSRHRRRMLLRESAAGGVTPG